MTLGIGLALFLDEVQKRGERMVHLKASSSDGTPVLVTVEFNPNLDGFRPAPTCAVHGSPLPCERCEAKRQFRKEQKEKMR